MRSSLNLRSLPNGVVTHESPLGVNQMRGENGVNQCRFSKTSLSLILNYLAKRFQHKKNDALFV